MTGVPSTVGLAEQAAQTVEHGLGDQRHGHLAVTDVEVHRSGPVPSQGLMGAEELLDVPPLGIVPGQGVLIPVGRGKERPRRSLREGAVWERCRTGPHYRIPNGRGSV